MAASTPRATSPQTEPFPPFDPGMTPSTSVPPKTLPLPVGPPRPTPSDGKPNHLSPRTPIFSNPAYTTTPPKPGGLIHSPRASPVPLTGQSAMADLRRKQQQERSNENLGRQTSPNPAVQAMTTLMGGGGVSRPSDAPAPGKLSEPLRKVAEKINLSDTDNSLQVSPTSVTSFGSLESIGHNTAMTSTADSGPTSDNRQYVAEPAQMDDENARFAGNNGHLSTNEDEGNKAFSYPGPPPRTANEDAAGNTSRGMSFPGFGQGSPGSPPASTNKRHKCPFCATDFTRHHNLKSHLLTHSQEKPYECQTCQSRFRRLHDLKRHTKLHTGERPHTCDKCGRRFARGDALARHNKGPGGCAGRRTSFNGEDDYGPDGNGEGMDGVEYTGGNEDEDSREPSERRVSEPSRKRPHAEILDDTSRDSYRQHSSTYPPAPTRGHLAAMSNNSNMGPPQVVHPGSNTSASPREPGNRHSPAAVPYYGPSNTSAPGSNNSGQVLDQRSMIESPKPLSPGHPMDSNRLSVGDASMSSNRHRSPSLTTQFQHTHFGRGGGVRTPPQAPLPFISSTTVLPPLQNNPNNSNNNTNSNSSSNTHQQHQQPPSHRLSLGPSAPSSHPQQSSNPSSLSSHGRGSGSGHGMTDGSPGGDIWGYVRSLEQRFGRMQDEYELRLSRLHEELITLKGQVSAAAASQYASGQSGESMSGVTRY